MTIKKIFSLSSAKKRLVFILILSSILLVAWYYLSDNRQSSKEGQTGLLRTLDKGDDSPPLPVQITSAQKQNFPYYLFALGSVTPVNKVTVRSQISGQLVALHFLEGQQVNANDLLAEIDPRPFEVALLQTQGNLQTAQASLANAKRDLTRYQNLRKNNLISAQQIDTQQSVVEERQGNLKAAQSAVAKAKLQLDYSRISAPISGRVGLKQIDIGNIITTSDNIGIVVITQTQPIDVLFSLAESDISSVLKAQQHNTDLLTEIWDRNNQILLAEGKLLSIDNLIDSTTGTVKLKARFNNQDNTLLANQFVNVRLKIATLQDAIVVPSNAVQINNTERFVWVVNKENKVNKRVVQVGRQDGEQIIIRTGVAAGEQIVTDGIDRLSENRVVEVVKASTTLPANQASTANSPPGNE